MGSVPHLSVTGCTHTTVGGIVRGNFTANGQNHGRPTYKKDAQVNGLDVQLPGYGSWCHLLERTWFRDLEKRADIGQVPSFLKFRKVVIFASVFYPGSLVNQICALIHYI